MVLRPRAAALLVAVAWCAGIAAVPVRAAAPLPPPRIFDDEYVVVSGVVSARDVVVVRSDGTPLRVRLPDVTAPVDTADGASVCGAAPAKDALAKLLPVGSKVLLWPATRLKRSSWAPFDLPGDDVDDGVYASDGSFYADFFDLDPPVEHGLSAAQSMLALGWLRTGVALEAALADPSEIGLSSPVSGTFNGDEWRATDRRRGVWGQCLGDFRSSGVPAAVPTSWKTTPRGWVQSIGGVSIHRDRLKTVTRGGRKTTIKIYRWAGMERFVAAWGRPGSVTLVPGGCLVEWPERGVRIVSKSGADWPVPPRSEAACLALPILSFEGHGAPTLLGSTPLRTPFKTVERSLGPVQRSLGSAYVGGRTVNGRLLGQLQVGLDLHGRLASLQLELGS